MSRTSQQPPNERTRQLLANEDWRFHAIDSLYTGDGIVSIMTSERFDGRDVHFSLPGAPALYLNLAREARKRRSAIDVMACFIDHPHPQGTWPEDHRPLFDFFEAITAEVIFSFTALEAFANECVPKDFSYVHIGRDKTETLDKDEIERRIQLDEKLKRVLPKAHSLKSPAGTKVWQEFKILKNTRDRLIHMKSVDRQSSGPENQTIWGMLIEARERNFPAIALDMIGAFPSLVADRRWHRLAKAAVV